MCNRSAVNEVAAVGLLLRAATGAFDDAVHHWIGKGLRTWLRAGGAIDLSRALRIPRNPQRFLRDHYLCVAAGALKQTDDPPNLARALTREWNTFVTRGPWVAWRDAGGPPENASVLRSALYHATVASGGRVLGQRQLKTIISQGNIGRDQFPAACDTLQSFHDERQNVMTFLNREHLSETSLRREWDEKADLRAEFGGNFARYVAYRNADATGLVKIFAKPKAGGH